MGRLTVPFRDYVDRCLFDARFGYYARGVVRFGDAAHFSTFPQRLSPGFGWMLADALAWLLRAPMADGRLPGPVTILEIGAGDGALACDTLDRLCAATDDPLLGPLAQRVEYVIGERSPALRGRQRERLAKHIGAGRARVIEMDARRPRWQGPFHGAVVCNELLDAMSCDRLRVWGPDRVERVHVTLEHEGDPWEAVARGERPAIRELSLPLEADAVLAAHLDHIRPLIEERMGLGRAPLDLTYGADVPGFMDGLAGMLRGPGSWGLGLVVDYGGTSRHMLDPHHRHLRVYGDPALAHSDSPYQLPGQLDITWDVDFSQLGRLAAERGLRLHHFGHQRCLESGATDLWGDALRPHLVEGRRREGARTTAEAEREAERLVFNFREANGFRTAILGPPGLEVPKARFGASDAWEVGEVPTVGLGATEAARAALEGLDLPDPAGWLLPGCDVVANLSAIQWYEARHEVLARLEAAGVLRRCMERDGVRLGVREGGP